MISKWKVKALVQKGISYLPKKDKINYMFQKYVTKGVFLTDEYFENKITHARDHINFYKKYANVNFEQSDVLELGTGWYPIVPIALYLSDFRQVISIDIQSWMTKASQLTTIDKFIEWRKNGKLDEYLNDINEEKWNILVKLVDDNNTSLTKQDINDQIKLQTVVRDATRSELPDHSIDFICSNNTFEHIPKEVLKNIVKEFKIICKKDGVMSHFIDLSDHFAHFDKSINIYNFLKYSEATWDLIDNDIQPQNRMRFRDYRDMYAELEIPITAEEIRKGDLPALKTIDLADQYKGYSNEELAVSHGYIVSKMV